MNSQEIRHDEAAKSATPVEKPALGLPAILLGSVVGTTPAGEPLVTWQGAPRPMRARCVWLPTPLDWDRCMGVSVALGFIDGDGLQPLILGLMTAPQQDPEQAPSSLRLESKEELVLECGRARVALRADGKITIAGDHLLSRATVTNKVQGGSVQIN